MKSLKLVAREMNSEFRKPEKLKFFTEVAGEVGPDLAPQKMKLPSKLRHYMG